MDKNKEVKLIKLRSISDERKLEMINAILADNNIPYIKKDYGTGGYMKILGGSSLYATDVMVSEDDFNKADELLKSINID